MTRAKFQLSKNNSSKKIAIDRKKVTSNKKSKTQEIKRSKYYHWCYKLPAETRLSTRLKSRSNIIKYTAKNIDKVDIINGASLRKKIDDKSKSDEYTRPANRNVGNYFYYLPLLKKYMKQIGKAKKLKASEQKQIESLEPSEQKQIESLEPSEQKQIESLEPSEQEKINILDSGAGYGRALVDMINHRYIKDYIGTATAVSMHYFSSMPQFLAKYGEKLEWFLNRSQNVLPLLPANNYDIICDLFAAYHYSVDRVFLLEQYYRALRPGGKAFVWCYYGHDNIFVHHSSTKKKNLTGEKKSTSEKKQPAGEEKKSIGEKKKLTYENKELAINNKELTDKKKQSADKKEQSTGKKKQENNTRPAIKNKKGKNKYESFIGFLARTYPSIFSIRKGLDNGSYLIITKPQFSTGEDKLTLSFDIAKYRMKRKFRKDLGWITYPWRIIVEPKI